MLRRDAAGGSVDAIAPGVRVGEIAGEALARGVDLASVIGEIGDEAFGLAHARQTDRARVAIVAVGADGEVGGGDLRLAAAAAIERRARARVVDRSADVAFVDAGVAHANDSGAARGAVTRGS